MEIKRVLRVLIHLLPLVVTFNTSARVGDCLDGMGLPRVEEVVGSVDSVRKTPSDFMDCVPPILN